MLVQPDDEERLQGLCKKNGRCCGWVSRPGIVVVDKKEDRASHMIFADNCYLFAESNEQILKMIGDATEETKEERAWKEGPNGADLLGFLRRCGRSTN